MFSNILIAAELDYLDQAKHLITTALEISQGNQDAVYRLAGIVSAPSNSIVSSFLPNNFDKVVLEEGKKKLSEFTQGLFPEGKKVQCIVAYGTVYEEINRLAEELDVDIIIMMASRDHEKHGLSANTVKVARLTHRPMLVMR